MIQVTLILCVVPATWALFAPAVMPRVVHHVPPMHRMNVSLATQEVLISAWRNYSAHVARPNATWTLGEWKESLERCQKSLKETRKSIISKISHEDHSTVDHYLDTKAAEENLNFHTFLIHCKMTAAQLNLTRMDKVIEHMKGTLQPGCLKEMPPKVLAESWKKCRELVLADAQPDEKGRADIFLRRVKLRDLQLLSQPMRETAIKLKSVKAVSYTQMCVDEGRKAGLPPQSFEAVQDLIDEYLAYDEKMDKSHYTPKQWSDYQRARELQFFQLIEKAAANDPEHAEGIRDAFELIRIRHERLKIREKVRFLRRVKNTAAAANLSANTTALLVNELKQFLVSTHGHIGFGDEDEKRADQELTMCYGIIKMRLLDKIPVEEQENLAHFFFTLSRDLPDAQQQQHHLRQALQAEEDPEPFENYTTTVARSCHMWNDSLYTFWETHYIIKPGPLVIKHLNQLDYFKRKAMLLKKWDAVKNLTLLSANPSQAEQLNCFFRALEKDFVKARRSALYSNIQTDEMNFVGSFRKTVRIQSKRVNMSTGDLDSMLEIVRILKPNVVLPEIEDPTVEQLREAYNNTSNFMTSFKEQCYATIKDHEGLNKLFVHLEFPYQRFHLTTTNLEDNGFICDTPQESEHKLRGGPTKVIILHPRPITVVGTVHLNQNHGPAHGNTVHDMTHPQKVHHHHHNPLHAHKHKGNHKQESTTAASMTTTEAESVNSTFD